MCFFTGKIFSFTFFLCCLSSLISLIFFTIRESRDPFPIARILRRSPYMSRSLDLAFLLIQLSFPLQKNNTDQINEVYEFFFVQG